MTTNYQVIAERDEDWKAVKASFALEGIETTAENADRAGRLIAGEISLEQGLEEVRKKYAADSSNI